MKILNFGSLNIDYVYQMDHIITGGESETASRRQVFPGGKGLNQSIALARAGAEVWHAGVVGEDGGNLVRLLEESGVRTDLIRTDPDQPTGHTFIQVDRSGQNAIVVYGGANRSVTKDDIREALENFEEGDMILLQNEVNAIGEILEEAKKRKLFTVLNPSPFNEVIGGLDPDVVDLYFVNEIEGAALTREKANEPEAILDGFAREFKKSRVVLTLGDQGSCYMDPMTGERFRQAAIPTETVDTTAAGDTFTGYFLAEMTKGRPVEDCLKTASAAASIAVSREGAAPSIPEMEDVKTLLQQI